ncbi:MAG: hypothetical protein U5R31_02220 [Acidimicrobiia bacterium]|nr:hypothetical protein [Acidimicrobiia bacterium]
MARPVAGDGSADVVVVERLLGRRPEGHFEVVVARPAGRARGHPQQPAAGRRPAHAHPLLAGG